jgi:two-component system NarL family sensor kinase
MRGKGMEAQDQELYTLKVIAETLNKSNDLKIVLQHVLEKLLEVTGLQTGWLFLTGERPEYTFVASHGLPPALSRENKRPMCEGTCFCLNNLWEGRLKQPVNIINCKRLEDAKRLKWGDTEGITHHATVPISASGEILGILNVAAPDKQHFNKKELHLLQSVALQIGTAIKRTRLYEVQEGRANYFTRLDEVTRQINRVISLKELPNVVTQKTCELIDVETCWFFLKKEEQYVLVSKGSKEQSTSHLQVIHSDGFDELQGRVTWDFTPSNEIIEATTSSFSAVKLGAGEEIIGVLLLQGSLDRSQRPVLHDILSALSSHVSLAIENLRLYEKQRELEVLEERNRLARDLHDSVNQTLFSLSLTAKGALSLSLKEKDAIKEAMTDIHNLSKHALQEMKALIWQLRPVGLEDGLTSAIKKYGTQIGVQVAILVSGFIDLPKKHEECLFRITQEALNNVRKHSSVKEAEVFLTTYEKGIELRVDDHGVGFEPLRHEGKDSTLGLLSMVERATSLGGTCEVVSHSNCGTTVMVTLPLNKEKEGLAYDN